MRSNGFTLINLLVTLTVMAMLFLISSAGLSLFVRNNEQQVILDEIRTMVQYARIYAVNSGQHLSLSALSPSGDWSKGVVLSNRLEMVRQWQWYHPHWVLKWAGARSSENISVSNNPAHAISNGQFTLVNEQTKDSVTIVLNRLGRVRIKN